MGLRYGTTNSSCSTPKVKYAQDSSMIVQSFVVKLGTVQHIFIDYTDGLGCSPCGTTRYPTEFQINSLGSIVVDPKVKFTNGVLLASIVQQGVVPVDHLDGSVKIAIDARDFNLQADEKYEILLSAILQDGRTVSQSFIVKLISPTSGVYGASNGSVSYNPDPIEVIEGVGIDVTIDGTGNDPKVSLDIPSLPTIPGSATSGSGTPSGVATSGNGAIGSGDGVEITNDGTGNQEANLDIDGLPEAP